MIIKISVCKKQQNKNNGNKSKLEVTKTSTISHPPPTEKYVLANKKKKERTLANLGQ